MSKLVEIVARVLAERNGVRQWQVCAKDASAALRAIEGAGYKIFSVAGVPAIVNTTYRARENGAMIKEAYQAAFDAAPTVGGE